jgi:hypothetical protein
MIYLLVLFFVSTLAVSQNEASNVLDTLSNLRISRPSTAQLPVVNTQSRQINKKRRRKRTKKIKGKAENARKLTQKKGIDTGRVQGVDRVQHVSRSNSNSGNLEENDAATSFSSIAGDDLSAFLSKDPTFDGSLSLNDKNNGDSEDDSEDDKPDWVKINDVSADDEWSIVDEVFLK